MFEMFSVSVPSRQFSLDGSGVWACGRRQVDVKPNSIVTRSENNKYLRHVLGEADASVQLPTFKRYNSSACSRVQYESEESDITLTPWQSTNESQPFNKKSEGCKREMNVEREGGLRRSDRPRTC